MFKSWPIAAFQKTGLYTHLQLFGKTIVLLQMKLSLKCFRWLSYRHFYTLVCPVFKHTTLLWDILKWDQSITHKKPMRNRKANTFLTVMPHLRPVCLLHQLACENHKDKACMHEKIGSLQDTRSTVYLQQAVTMWRCVCLWQVSCTVHERGTGGYTDSCRVMHWYCWQLLFANISRKAYWCLLHMQAFFVCSFVSCSCCKDIFAT